MVKTVVEVFWDDEAHVWVASTHDDVGLVTEADTIEELQRKLAAIIPDLLGDAQAGPFEIELVAPDSKPLPPYLTHSRD